MCNILDHYNVLFFFWSSLTHIFYYYGIVLLGFLIKYQLINVAPPKSCYTSRSRKACKSDTLYVSRPRLISGCIFLETGLYYGTSTFEDLFVMDSIYKFVIKIYTFFYNYTVCISVRVKKTRSSLKFLSELKQQASINLKYKTVVKKINLKYKTKQKHAQRNNTLIKLKSCEKQKKKEKTRKDQSIHIYPNGGKTTLM